MSTERSISPSLRQILWTLIWLLGLIILGVLSFIYGGDRMLIMFKGMNLEIPLPTKLFMTFMGSRIFALLLAVVWSGAAYFGHTHTRSQSDAACLATVLIGVLVVQCGFVITLGSAILPFFLQA